MAAQKVVISKDLKADLQEFFASMSYDKLFILTDIVVKKKDKREHKPAKRYVVLKKGVTGIVHIDIEGKFYVNLNDVKVPILKECYSTKGNHFHNRITQYHLLYDLLKTYCHSFCQCIS